MHQHHELPGDRDQRARLGALVTLACAGPGRLRDNDGSGTFADVSAAQLPPGVVDSTAVVLVDVEGDGDRDVVTAVLATMACCATRTASSST